MQIVGGHPEWMEGYPPLERDPAFRRLPDWYKYEVICLGDIHAAIPRCYSTAWVPPAAVMEELGRGEGPSKRSFEGWAAELAEWARLWFWQELPPSDRRHIDGLLREAQRLPLDFLPDSADREIARLAFALREWCSIALTTDVRTFWTHKRPLAAMGINVSLPSEVWDVMANQI